MNQSIAYARVVVGTEGKVLHVCPDTLYHPDMEEQMVIERMLNEGKLARLGVKENDCQVLVLFQRIEDKLAVIEEKVVQQGFKEYWQRRITKKIDWNSDSLRDEVHIQERIELWESTYNEAFSPMR